MLKFLWSISDSIGVIFSYLFLLVSCYLFNWDPFMLFFSYLLEIVILVLVLGGIRLIDERRRPEIYRKQQPFVNVLVAMFFFVMLHLFLIWLNTSAFDRYANKHFNELIYSKEVLFAGISMLFFYSLNAIQIKDDIARINTFQSNFFLKVILISLTNFTGLILSLSLEVDSLLVLMSIIVAIRIGFELFWMRKFNLL